MSGAAMIDLGPHGAYILASYGVAAGILGWMILASLLAKRATARRLAALESPASEQPENRRG